MPRHKYIQASPRPSRRAPQSQPGYRLVTPAPQPQRAAPVPPAPRSPTGDAADYRSSPRIPLPGAGQGVLVLGGSLAVVATWSSVLKPLLHNAWNGGNPDFQPAVMQLPATGIISLLLFLALAVFLASLSDDFANIVFLFLLGLWAVFLIMNPSVMQMVASWFAQQHPPVSQANTQGGQGA